VVVAPTAATGGGVLKLKVLSELAPAASGLPPKVKVVPPLGDAMDGERAAAAAPNENAPFLAAPEAAVEGSDVWPKRNPVAAASPPLEGEPNLNVAPGCLVVASSVPLALPKVNPGPGPGGDAAAPPWPVVTLVEAAGPSPAVANVEDGGGSCAIAAVSTSILPSPAGGSGGDRIAPAVDTPPCAATGAADGGSPAVSSTPLPPPVEFGTADAPPSLLEPTAVVDGDVGGGSVGGGSSAAAPPRSPPSVGAADGVGNRAMAAASAATCSSAPPPDGAAPSSSAWTVAPCSSLPSCSLRCAIARLDLCTGVRCTAKRY